MSKKSLRRMLFASTAAAFIVGSAITYIATPPAMEAQGSASTPAIGLVIPGVPSLAPLVKAVSPAVVNINVTGQREVAQNPFSNDPFFRRFFDFGEGPVQREFAGAGSGVVLDAQHGFIVTNSHVVENATEIKVSLQDERQVDAELVGTDPETDIAVLRIPAHNLTSLPLAQPGALQVGDFVVAIGQPFGLRHTVTSGIVSAVGRSGLNIEGYEDFIQTDASINPGNSGGALVNLNGELVGVNTAIVGSNGGNVGIGFAIPVDMVSAVTTQLIEHGKVTRGQMGVYIQDLAPDVAEAMGLQRHDGALVSQVEPGSSADNAGIKAGDVILSVNRMPVKDASALKNRIGLMQVGERVSIELVRNGQNRSVSLTLHPRTTEASRTVTPEHPGARKMDGVTLAAAEGRITGVRVVEINEGSQAYQSGLRQSDIITHVNRTAITSVRQFESATRDHQGPLLLDVMRGDRSLFIVVR